MKLSKLDFTTSLKKLHTNIVKINYFLNGILSAFEGDTH